MKYIIIKNQFGDETAILFDEILDHSAIAAGRPVIAAGFVAVKGVEDRYGGVNNETHCYGESVTLRIVSRREDTRIVEKALRNKL